jgi:glutathione peroxidase-family protein
MFSKIDVNFSSAHPLWVWLKEKQGGFMLNAIKWNFTKFIIDKEGNAVARLGPKDSPIPHVEKAIEKLF